MRQQFERDADSWKRATPVDQVLKTLKSILTTKK